MSPGDEDTWLWVRIIGRGWLLYLAPASGILAFLGVAVTLIGSAWFGRNTVIAGMGIVGASILLRLVEALLFTRLIVCPKCGHNPTRTKSGRARRDWSKVEKQLQRLQYCPKCGE